MSDDAWIGTRCTWSGYGPARFPGLHRKALMGRYSVFGALVSKACLRVCVASRRFLCNFLPCIFPS